VKRARDIVEQLQTTVARRYRRGASEMKSAKPWNGITVMA